MNMSNAPFESVKHIFKAYDIRGLLEEVTPELARVVGYAVVRQTGAKTVLVGRDMRETSPALLDAVVEGVNAAGARAVTIGMCTTSLFNYSVVSSEDIDGGIMVTASHNPAQYNGLKVTRHDGFPMTGVEMFDLLSDIPEIKLNPGIAAQNETRDMVESYLRYLMQLTGLKNGDAADMKVVVDFGNGMGAVTVARLLELLGAQTTYLYETPDARFPNHEANPAKHSTLKELQARVVELGATLGVAMDGDADRVGFVDNTGRILRGDQMVGLLAELTAKAGEVRKIVIAPNFGWDSVDAIAATGAEIVWEKIGRTSVIKKMREVGATLGGELSSHFFFAETHELEAVDYALMLVLKGLRESGKSFAEMVNHLYRFANSSDINLHVEDKAGAIVRVKEALRSEATTANELDGIRCEFGKDWWFILRASNTEPILRLTVEAKDQALLDEKIAFMTELIGGEKEI